MARHVRPRVPAAAAAVMAIVAACGSGASATPAPTETPSPTATAALTATPAPTAAPTATPTAVDPLAVIDRILAATATIPSARMTYSVVFEGSASVPDGTGMRGEGSFDFGEDLRVRMSLDMSDLDMGTMDIILDGPIVYMRGEALELPGADGRWILVDTSSDHPNAVLFGAPMRRQADPWANLYLLQGATAAPEVLERDWIDGDPVQRLRLQLDLEQAVDRATGATRDHLVVQVADLLEQGAAPAFEADVWVDEQDRLRRAVYRLEMSPLRGGGAMVLTYDFLDIGSAVELELPDEGDVVDIEDLSLEP